MNELSLEELASYLHLTPAQVQKLASRDKIPGRKVGGEWRFNESEIHHWLEEQIGVADDQALEKVEHVLQQRHRKATGQPDLIRISDLMPLECIAIPLTSRSKSALIRELCDHLAHSGWLWDPESMTQAILAREELHPTALDNGVALLHPRRPLSGILPDRYVAGGVTRHGVPFGGPRGSLTDVFFLLASTDDAGHLRTLARLSRLLSQSDLLQRIRAAESPHDVLEAIRAADALLDGDSGSPSA